MMKHQWGYERMGWTALDQETRRIFEDMELDFRLMTRDLRILNEAEMTDAQIDALFKAAETISKEKGHRTGFGKMVNGAKEAGNMSVQIAKSINAWLDENVVKRLEQSKTLEDWQPKYEQLKATARAKFGKTKYGERIMKSIDWLGSLMERKPLSQSIIIGAITAIIMGSASLGFLGTVGLAAGIAMLLTGMTEAIKGSKLGVIAGKAAKSGILAGLTAGVVAGLRDIFSLMQVTSVPVGPSDAGVVQGHFEFREVGRFGNTLQRLSVDQMMFQDDLSIAKKLVVQISNGGDAARSAVESMRDLALRLSSTSYQQDITSAIGAAGRAAAKSLPFNLTLGWISNLVNVAGSVATGAAAAFGAKGRATTAETMDLSQPVMEGLWADLTLKFGAGKLRKAWLQFGQPNDSVEIAKMLAQMGMEDAEIRDAFSKAGLSDEDVESTMDGLHSQEHDDTELPFETGDEEIDTEARKILRLQGEDALKKFYQEKLAELKKKAELSRKTELVNKIRSLSTAKDAAGMKSLVASITSMDEDTKKRLLGFVVGADIADDEKEAISALINKATVAEMSLFEEMSAVLRESRMSWKDLGYRYVIKERRTNTVILV